jgi:hypothetical protein
MYKTSVSGPLLRCLSKAEGQEILQEVHEGIYGGHIGARALAANAPRQGLYWSAMINDAAKLVSICDASQKFSHCHKAPTQLSQFIAPSWPL